jgi:hypothetical protein
MNGRIAWGLIAGILIGSAAIAAAPTPASADGASGSKESPCPLQKWMRDNMGKAMADGDMDAVAKALDKVSKIAPDPTWNGNDPNANWDAIAKAGISAAKSKDTDAVKATCKTCHNAFKDKYKATFRTKAVP